MWKLIDDNKHKDKIFINLLRLVYSIFRSEFVSYIVLTIITLFIPVVFQSDDKTPFWILITLFIIISALKYLCFSYKKHCEHQTNRIFRTLDLQSETVSSINYLILSTPKWQKNFFEKTCEIVCSKVKELFSAELNLKTRVSVEYVHSNNKNNQKMIKMVGRQSSSRQNASREKLFADKKKYYIYKIFDCNNSGENILRKQEIDEPQNWFTNKLHNVKVNEYWGIAIEENNIVKFVLQIDFLDETKMKDSEIHSFIKDNLRTFIQIIRMSYLIEIENINSI